MTTSDPSSVPPQAPIPVEPLPYTMPSRFGRPGVLTAIGVISICVAAISGLFALYSVLMGFGFYMASAMSQRQSRATTATLVAPVPPAPPVASTAATMPSGPQVGPLGMSPAERDAAFQSLNGLRPLGPSRRRQLDTILAAAGKSFATDRVIESGTMEDARDGEPGPEYFVTQRGRLEIFNDRAVFFPNDNSPTIRTSAPFEVADAPATGPATGPATAPTTVPAGSVLTAAEVQSVVSQVQAMTGNKLTPLQVTSVQSVLTNPTQLLVPPGTAQGSITAAHAQPDGTVMMNFANGSMLMLGPQGNVVAQTTPMTVPFGSGFAMSPWVVGSYVALSVVSLGLAVLLLVAGILVLSRSTKGRRLHLIYAWLKIPVAVAASLLLGTIMSHLGSAFATTAAGSSLGAGWMVGTMVLGCLYPVALLIALNTRTVRDYYHSARAAQ